MYPFFMRWLPTDLPLGLAPEWSVHEPGIEGLRPKRWWDPRWRWQWPQRVYQVDSDGKPYHVYFIADGGIMRTWWPVRTPLFSARIGPNPVTFYAVAVKSSRQFPITVVQNGDVTPI